MSASLPTLAPPQRTFLGHPLGLYVLFFTEMWERFSYYGMRALLMLYMVNYIKWSQENSSTIYKVYTSFVYVTPVIGGFLADRYLGNRRAVIIGAVLMAIGQFMLAFEQVEIFIGALVLLIIGNGFFKPNMSVQVGRLYPANDGRRDAAYTIFYMGINLGAFLAPLACGWLADNTVGGYHSGFVMAGIGMVLGLVIYLLGQPFIHEIDPNAAAEKDVPAGMPTDLEGATSSEGISASQQKQGLTQAEQQAAPPAAPTEEAPPLSEAEAENTPSVLGTLNAAIPATLYVLAALMVLGAPVYYGIMWAKADPKDLPNPIWAIYAFAPFWNALMLAIGGVSMGLVGYVCAQVKNAVRDRVLAILILGVFVVFFWAAFEQAGNVLNLWADKNTNKYLWTKMQPPKFPVKVSEEKKEEVVKKSTLERFATMFTLKPPDEDEKAKSKTWWQVIEDFFNPLSTAAFQSVNALAIFVLAPIFAMMWVWLDERKMQPSIALKMFLGLVLMSLSVAVMIGAAKVENNQSEVSWSGDLPKGLVLVDGDKVGFKDEEKEGKFHAGRLTLADGELRVMGVLPDTERDNVLEKTAPKWFKDAVKELAELSEQIGPGKESITQRLDKLPDGFDMQYSGLKKSVISFDPEKQTFTIHEKMKTREKKGLLVAGSDPKFRETLGKLFVRSATFRVSSWWLFWSYLLATLGELCLSPVGLSMVSKLAPARYATMLMGVWMLTSAFGNYVAGIGGELWGKYTPDDFFTWLAVFVAVASLLLLLLVRLVVSTMHGVK